MFSVAITKSLSLWTLCRKQVYLAHCSEVSRAERQHPVGRGRTEADGLMTDGLVVVGIRLAKGFRAGARLDFINPFSPELTQSNRQT